MAVAAAAVLALAGCDRAGDDGPAVQAEPIELRVGFLAPLTGEGAGAGKEALRGAQLAAELINNGVLGGGDGPLPRGVRVTVVAGDTKGDPDQGVLQAARLVDQEGVVALAGAGSPTVMAAASDRAERLAVPFVSGDVTAADFLTERGLAWFFRTAPTQRTLAESLFSALRQEAGGDAGRVRVAILYPDEQADSDNAAMLGELAGEGGFDLAAILGVAPTADLAGVVVQLQAERPDAILLVAGSPAAAKRLITPFKQREAPVKAVLGFGAGFADPAFHSAAGRDAIGLLYSASWSARVAERSPAARTVLHAYEERHNQPMPEAAAGSFTAVHALAQATARAGAATPEALRAALLGLDLSGRSTIMPWDGIRFDAAGQNVRAIGLVQRRGRDGARVVFPPGLRDGEPPPEPAP